MSKGVKKVLSFAAAIAIPYFAPIIAGSTALAGVTATLGTTATSALVGAGLGAAKGAILGEDIGRSALMGGFSGGVSGYLQAPSAPAGGAVGGTGLTPPTVAAAPGSQYALTGGGGYGLTAPSATTAFDAGMGGAGGLSYGGMTAGGAGLSGAMASGPVDYSLTSATPSFSGGATTNYGLTGGATDYSLTSAIPVSASGAGATAAAPKTFTEAIKAVPQEIAKKFSDPKNLADLTLRAAGQLAGSLFAGDGLSAEEQALLEAQTEELRQLQSTNQGLFQQKLNEAQRLIGESKYFDPEYFGLQSARRAQTQGAVAKSAGLRGLTGERRTSESRRYDLATGRATGTAFDTGFQSAIGPRLQTQQVGLSAMPGYLNYQTPATTAQLNAEELKRQRRASEVEGIQTLFGSLTETPQASSRG
jgi:hypothetical protein